MLRLLLYVALAWGVYRLVRGLFAGAGGAAGGAPGPPEDVDDEMLGCPECATFFPSRMGVSRRAGGGRRAFCSADCAERFARRGGPPEE